MGEKKVIGLTGLYAAGKNHVALLLEKRGIPVLDVDVLGHKVIEAERDLIIERFGEDITGEDEKIDRKLLGRKVFGNTRELKALEDIVHPAVNRETLAWINDRNEGACVINAALLHLSSAAEMLDAVLIVEAPFITRLLRARRRDKLPWRALLKRFLSQKKCKYQFYSGKTDIYRVSNSLNCSIPLCCNPGDCADSGSKGAARQKAKLEIRIDEILSLMGLM